MENWILELFSPADYGPGLSIWLTGILGKRTIISNYSPITILFEHQSQQPIDNLKFIDKKKKGYRIYRCFEEQDTNVTYLEPFDPILFVSYFLDPIKQIEQNKNEYQWVKKNIEKGNLVLKEWVQEAIQEGNELYEQQKLEEQTRIEKGEEPKSETVTYKKRSASKKDSFSNVLNKNKDLKTKRKVENSLFNF